MNLLEKPQVNTFPLCRGFLALKDQGNNLETISLRDLKEKKIIFYERNLQQLFTKIFEPVRLLTCHPFMSLIK